MDTQIKEEAKDPSLCFETSGDNISSMSLIEKYDLFIQTDQLDPDSDGEFFSDDDLKEHYAQFRNDSNNRAKSNNHRLSTCLPAKYRNNDQNLLVVDEESVNGTDIDTSNEVKPDFVCLNQLIEKLKSQRTCGDEGNSIFCTESELEAIQESYGQILDYISEKASNFERSNSYKDLTTPPPDNQDDKLPQNNTPVEIKDQQTLEAKMTSVRLARDKFYEVESQVKEQLEQLELVERYKMESVG